MASDYGLNFGFRRSDESMRVAEGRLKTPVADPVLLLGTAVKQDNATPDRLEVAAADEELITGYSGLLLQEEAWDRSFYEGEIIDSFELGKAKKDRRSVITSGAGVKVWFKNTAAQTRADGRSIAAVDLVDFTNDAEGAAVTWAVGDLLGWSGSAWVKITTGATVSNAWGKVTSVDASKEYLEAVLLG